MQINTSTLLSMLGSNIDNNVKQKIQDASSSGKTDIATIVKDKTIQTVLSDTFKGLIEGSKDKTNTLQTLQNSKHMFDIKSFSNDIKNLSEALAKSENPKLQQQSVILKDFFVNIKNLDENVLKTNFSNSGVMLESKLNDIATLLKEPVLTNKMQLQRVLQDLSLNIKSILQNGINTSSVLNIKENINTLTQIVNRSPDLQSSIKTAVSNLLNNINKSALASNMQPNASSLNNILSDIKNIDLPLSKDIGKTARLMQLHKDIANLSNDLKSILSKGLEASSLESLKSNISKLESTSQKGDIKLEIKTAVSNLLNNLNTLVKTPASLNQPQVLNNHLSTLQNISKNVETASNEPIKQEIQPKLSDVAIFIKNTKITSSVEVQKGLADLSIHLKNLSQNNTPQAVQTLKVQVSNMNNTLPTFNIPMDQKVQVSNLLNHISSFLQTRDLETLPQQQNSLNNILSSVSSLSSQISNALEQNLLPQQKELLPFLNDNKVMNTLELQKGVQSLTADLNSIMNLGISELQVQNLQNSVNNVVSTLTKGDMLQLEVKTAVTNLLNSAKQIVQNPRIQPQMQLLSTLITAGNTISSNIPNISLSPLTQSGQMQVPSITNDIKGVLLQVMEQIDKGDANVSKEVRAIVEKTLTQIEYFQALSYSSSSNHTYLPFSWENIEEGDIKFASHGKDNFSCQINLQMKQYGEIRILLELDKKNYLNINLGVADTQFKAMIQEKLQVLRKGISNINLNLQGLNIFDLQKSDLSQKNNAYNSGDALNFGVDIKV